MNLLKAPAEYDREDQSRLRRALEAADGENLKGRKDLYFLNGERIFRSYATGITAHAGGGKASATVLTKQINHITTCATAADSLLMMPAKAGLQGICIINRGASACQVFGQGTDTINDVATATGVSQGSNTMAYYDCPVDGKWYRLLTA